MAVAGGAIVVGVLALSVLESLSLHAWTPWYHVCSKLEPPPPHLLNQAPPGAQQLNLLSLPFLKVPHFEHTDLVTIFDVVVGNVGEDWEIVVVALVAGAAAVVD